MYVFYKKSLTDFQVFQVLYIVKKRQGNKKYYEKKVKSIMKANIIIIKLINVIMMIAFIIITLMLVIETIQSQAHTTLSIQPQLHKLPNVCDIHLFHWIFV